MGECGGGIETIPISHITLDNSRDELPDVSWEVIGYLTNESWQYVKDKYHEIWTPNFRKNLEKRRGAPSQLDKATMTNMTDGTITLAPRFANASTSMVDEEPKPVHASNLAGPHKSGITTIAKTYENLDVNKGNSRENNLAIGSKSVQDIALNSIAVADPPDDSSYAALELRESIAGDKKRKRNDSDTGTDAKPLLAQEAEKSDHKTACGDLDENIKMLDFMWDVHHGFWGYKSAEESGEDRDYLSKRGVKVITINQEGTS
ncbi:hypothetical protein BU23DRAFT_565508 [Bimuria novae-zelandiae CBS 107.79]|uniref:Uncharacterized protein n=1 Tax=Bimuria novae-zelandiae CBS 107.79 TaxID=1447943 RepID=A0A6A5VK71_9PLEO|nr:hypothetical protein BU23DRAFT_565508 [Bimuria novae-zelandiae CBS 107.79]